MWPYAGTWLRRTTFGVKQGFMEGKQWQRILCSPCPLPSSISVNPQVGTEGKQDNTWTGYPRGGAPRGSDHRLHACQGRRLKEGSCPVWTPVKWISRADTGAGKPFLSLLDLILVRGVIPRPGHITWFMRGCLQRLKEQPALPARIKKSPLASPSSGRDLLPAD